MNKLGLISVMGPKINNLGFLVQQNAPQIMTTVGSIGVLGGSIYACKKTLDWAPYYAMFLRDTDETRIDLETARAKDIEGVETEVKIKDIEEYRKIAIKRFIKDSILTFGIPASIVLGSLGLLVGSNIIMQRRNASLVAAYTLVDKAFKSYRSRVKEEFGEDVDRYLRFRKARSEKMIISGEDGKAVNFSEDETSDLETETCDSHEGNKWHLSEYARWFDSKSCQWKHDPNFNEYFLASQERYANDLLNARGHCFLNEVYDMLGLERSKAGAVVGWIKRGGGDGFVDFGIYNPKNIDASCTSPTITNDGDLAYTVDSDAILLDFNVDGIVYNKI